MINLLTVFWFITNSSRRPALWQTSAGFEFWVQAQLAMWSKPNYYFYNIRTLTSALKWCYKLEDMLGILPGLWAHKKGCCGTQEWENEDTNGA